MPIATRTGWHLLVALVAGFALAGCGGGGGGGNSPVAAQPAPVPTSGWVAGSFLPAASFAGKCMNPRSGTDPNTGQPYNEVLGTATDENNWLRSWSNDLYLWYSEIVDRDPGLSATSDYFKALKTTAIDAVGPGQGSVPLHVFDRAVGAALAVGRRGGLRSCLGVVAGLPPRRVVVAYIGARVSGKLRAPALERGEEVQSVDGTDVVSSNTQAEVDRFVAGLYPENTRASCTRSRCASRARAYCALVQLQSVAVTKTPVRYSTGARRRQDWSVTCCSTTTSRRPSSSWSRPSIRCARRRINDLVLDLRYNGGGLPVDRERGRVHDRGRDRHRRSDVRED